jgi:hypothetical protein
MLRAFESALDWRLNLEQRSLLPWLVLPLWALSWVALCDALGIRVCLGLSLGLAAALALALVGDAIVAALFGGSLRCFAHSSPPWIVAWSCSSTCSCLGW